MEFINVFDEQGRFVELRIFDNGNNLQQNSHGYSYNYSAPI